MRESGLTVHIDGVIFARQPHGGISRNFVNLMNAIGLRPDTRPILHLNASSVQIENLNPLPLRHLPRRVNLRPQRLFSAVSTEWNGRREAAYWRSVGSGIFHSSYYTSPDGVRLPQVLTMHDVIFEDFPGMFRLPQHQRHIDEKKRAMQRCAAFLTPSRYSMERTLAHYEIGKRLTRVVPHAVDPVFRVNVSATDVARFHKRASLSKPFLLHVGSRYLHKNVDRLLVAFSGWQHRGDFSLVLAGGGPLRPEELALIHSSGIARDVIVLPKLGSSDLVLAYHAASALVFPSLSEGFGFPVLEAMACGTPVACARSGSLEEVGNQFPVYFDPTDVDDIKLALDGVLNARCDTQRWQRARVLALSRTWDEVAADYVSLYRQVLGK